MNNIRFSAIDGGSDGSFARHWARLSLALFLACLTVAARGDTVLIPVSAAWKYVDNGADQGSAWRGLSFSDQDWKSGSAELGYGDGDEATVVGFGQKTSNKYITTYFRHTFTVEDPAVFETLHLNLKRDDGAIIYLNGVEIVRSNIPAGTVASSTRASTAVEGANELVALSVAATNLLAGQNVIGVEIHQASPTSTDISFALGLEAVIKTPSTTVVPSGATWKYLDDGSEQGTEWKAVAFDDAAWISGPAELGYGDGGEQTVINSGPTTSKFITTYFRHDFDVADPAEYAALNLRLMRDDGAIVYLNGVEVHRSNMPAGAVNSTTQAPVAVGGIDESTFYQTTVANTLIPGRNVLAVEIHQSDSTSTDVSFDLEILGLTEAPDVTITRGPYLQNATPASMVIRWRTDVPTASKVWIGLTPAELTQTEENVAFATEHEIEVTGLQPNTQYYYAVGAGTGQIASGSEYTFFTPPPAGAKQPFRVWVLGDSGTANANSAAVRNAYNAFNGSRYTDMWLMLGDNAYTNGTDSEFQAAVFNVYPSMLRQSPLWSTLGNHDHHTAEGAPYFDIHTFPTQGEAGGVASGTEKYYSFDYGNVHFICLDSMSSDRSSTGPMATWLQADLESTTQDWIVAFFHHPPYTKGSHNSDNPTGADIELLQMRENFLPLLEAGGVDLVLGGHSHTYERSYLIDGHYGLSQTFSDSMKKASGDGHEIDGVGAYAKPFGLSSNQGAVYAVAGSSGKATNWWGGSTALENPSPHPAMVVSLLKMGSLVLDVDGGRLDVKFLNSVGTVDDQFTIHKDLQNSPPTVAILSPLNATTVNTPVTVTAEATPGPESEGGSLVQVDFYADDQVIGTAAAPSPGSSQFEIIWNSPLGGTHTLTATAWDDMGASTTSSPVTVTVNLSPTVSITNPVQNAGYEMPATISIAAVASDNDGTVTQVAFYAGGQLLGTDVAAPFEANWENVPAGTYQLTAVASDDLGATSTSSAVTVKVTAPNLPPAVSLTNPGSGSSFEESTTIQLLAAASDEDGTIAKVEFYAGTQLLFTATASPYAYNWANVAAGSYTITAIVTDNAGATTTSASASIVVNPNMPPTVSLMSPTHESVFIAPATVSLSANASDSDGNVARVEFYSRIGASEPTLAGLGIKNPESNTWECAWSIAAAGTYTLTAVAVDNSGATTTSASIVTITVEPAPNMAPTVTISSPGEGASYMAPADVVIAASASDSDGTIARVEFYWSSSSQGLTLIQADATAPFSTTWNSVPAGAYLLTAVAVDDDGASATSAPVNVVVRANVAPTVVLTSPQAPTLFTAPATVLLAADATDVDGSITSVEFYAAGGRVGTDVSAPYTYNWSNVAAGTYAITAVAIDDAGARTISGAVSISVSPEPEPTLNAPSKLTLRASKDRIDLSWVDESNNEIGFHIERSLDGLSWTRISTVAANVKSYRDASVDRNTFYFYRVQAYNDSVESGYSPVESLRSR